MTTLFDLQGKTALITGASNSLPATPYCYAVANGEQFAGSLLTYTISQIKYNKAREAEAYIKRVASNDDAVKNGNWYY